MTNKVPIWSALRAGFFPWLRDTLLPWVVCVLVGISCFAWAVVVLLGFIVILTSCDPREVFSWYLVPLLLPGLVYLLDAVLSDIRDRGEHILDVARLESEIRRLKNERQHRDLERHNGE